MNISSRRRLLGLYFREGWRRLHRRFALTGIALRRVGWRGNVKLLVAPTDLRATDVHTAEEILDGQFPLAGRLLDPEGLSPFEVDLPSREFAVRLHSFAWLRHMRTVRGEHVQDCVRRLVDDWMQLHGRDLNALAWQPDVTAQRCIAWLSHSPIILKDADHAFYRRFLKSLSMQLKFLQSIAGHVSAADARLRIRIAIAMASLCMDTTQKTIKTAASHLDRELDAQILSDGTHISRDPRVILELLLDLLPLRQTYVNLGHDAPPRLVPCIDRMYPALRFFRHKSGDLALFNGATTILANELVSVLRYDETAGAPFRELPDGDYHRLAAEDTMIVIDTGKPRSLTTSRTAHAGCLSFEMSSGRYRFIVNSGAPRFAGERFRQMARGTACHSTVTINDTSSARLSRSAFLGPVMLSGVKTVSARRDAERSSGFDRIVATHDGYADVYGVLHQRDIALRLSGGLVRGQDHFQPLEGRSLPETLPAVARFHIHPAITLRRRGESEVLMSAAEGEVWAFSCRDGLLDIEEDVFFADPSGMRTSQQITVSFDIVETPEIQWVIAREA
ncbi:heparinase II/III family protein [Rhizobium sp. SG2393]|uniref:heparinase II/III family protein n=1 Tax=Rhizobium sp. SG2393 TaxID=3276279 RepID=UPI003672DB68